MRAWWAMGGGGGSKIKMKGWRERWLTAKWSMSPKGWGGEGGGADSESEMRGRNEG